MLHKVKALSLGTVKYGENSRVFKCLTDTFGLQTYMVSDPRAKNAVMRPSMLQPLSQLRLVVYHRRNKKGMERIREASWMHHYENLQREPVKSALSLFTAEMLQKIISEEEGDEKLFDFLSGAFRYLDENDESTAHFPLALLAQLTAFFGITPDMRAAREDAVFDLRGGAFTQDIPPHPDFLTGSAAHNWHRLFDTDFEEGLKLGLSREDRRVLLQDLLQFYRFHIDRFGELKSYAVLRELFGT